MVREGPLENVVSFFGGGGGNWGGWGVGGGKVSLKMLSYPYTVYIHKDMYAQFIKRQKAISLV